MYGRWVTVPLCRTIEIRGNLIRLLRNMPCAKGRLWRGISRLYCWAVGQSHFRSEPLGYWRQSADDGRSADFRFQFLGVLRMVDVADDLPQQVARLGQKDSSGI